MPIAVMIGVEREHQIDDDDLHDHPRRTRSASALSPASSSSRFDLGMNLVGRLGDQEQAAADEDDVTPRQRELADT